VPLASRLYDPGRNIEFYALGLLFNGISSTITAANFIVTIFKLRAPGMSFNRIPLFCFAFLAASFGLLFALPSLSVDLVYLFLDRNIGTHFFDPAHGGSTLLWQHLFWFFGHPEVYILILPGMGVASDVLSTFSRKPIFGYRSMVYAMVGIGFLSWIVWGHHMFQSGMNPAMGVSFTITTMVIAVPSAIKTFNWLGTLWGGTIRFTVPMLNGLAFVAMFVIGGLSGIFMASTPVDIFIHDTYYIVAHIHYVVFGGSVFGIFAAIYYWFPKMFGRMMNDTLGKIHFWGTFIFFNCTFFPMHILGVGGHMRRIYNPLQYEFLQPLQPINIFITVSALLLGLSQIPFVINFFWSLFGGPRAERNPWHANTLEWVAPTPTPHGNFETIPTVYRGPYEYSSPEVPEDYLPQDRPLAVEARGSH
jgi:cytochrome c oxidase subunit 1